MIAAPARSAEPASSPARARDAVSLLGDPGQRLWRRLLAELGVELRARCCMREDGHAGPAARVEERLVQAVWADRLYRAEELVTASGKKVEVLEPGRWNTGRGPDFLGARVALAGQELAGDVEIHVDSRDWVRHAHHQDFEYNNVALHVCLDAGDDRPYEEKQNGARLERLVLRRVLEPDLETLRRTLPLDEYPWGRPAELGRCHEHFTAMDPDRLRAFFLAAGVARVEERVERFAAQRRVASPLQLIYQTFLTGQGYKSNKTLYFLLGKRAPFEELLDHGRDVHPADRADLYLAALLHVAQLFPAQPDLFDQADDATRDYARRLASLWKPLRPYFADRIMPPTRRWFSGMRPAGFPARRLAAVSLLIDRLGDTQAPLFDVLCDRLRSAPEPSAPAKEWRPLWRDLLALVVVPADGQYFATRFTLGGKPCRPQALLGEPAARSLLFNVFLPMAILRAREQKDHALEAAAWRALHAMPALDENSVTSFMRTRLFGATGLDVLLLKSELAQQALFKVFADCCSSNERTCASCTLLSEGSQVLAAQGPVLAGKKA